MSSLRDSQQQNNRLSPTHGLVRLGLVNCSLPLLIEAANRLVVALLSHFGPPGKGSHATARRDTSASRCQSLLGGRRETPRAYISRARRRHAWREMQRLARRPARK